MKHTILSILLVTFVVACQQKDETPNNEIEPSFYPSMSASQLEDLQWRNEPDSFGIDSGTLFIKVGNGTDYFNNPEDSSVTGTAPLLYQEMAGDFVATAIVTPDFNQQWNAVALMVYLDSTNWIKYAFERSDATGPSVVSVVTKTVSDDANGAILNGVETLWLAIAKKENLYALHWSIDGKKFNMTRLTTLPNEATVKIGVEMQSPMGEHALHKVHFFKVEERTLENLRFFTR